MSAKPRATEASSKQKRDPRGRFVELANKRVNATILQIRLVGNLANKKNYEYTSEEAKKIIKALQREIDDLKTRFKGEEGDGDSNFNVL
jgi:ABC-type Fe3+-hydroxamate transport system substrate-binding protein